MSLIIKKNTTFKIPRTPPFLPSSLGGLALWLKPDAGLNFNGSDEVTEWTDQSSAGNNFSQDLDYIAYREGDIINGYDGVLFEGGRLNGDSDIVTGKTIYAVVRTLGFQVEAYAAILECTGGGLYSAIESTYWGSYFSGGYFPTNSLAPNTSAIIATLSDDGENYEFRRNGTSVLSGSDGGGFYSRSESYLGNDGSGGQPANVYISEIIVYDRVLTTPEIQQVEAYLMDKYAISPAPFSPTDIAGISLWLKADAGVTTSGGFVTAWADQSGNGNNCSSPNAVVLNSSPYPYIYFGGGDTESEITLHPDVFNGFSALSLFAVWNIVDNGNGGILGSDTYSNFEITTQDGSAVRMRNNNYASNINTGGLWYAEEFSLSTITADSSGGGSGTARRNGTGVDFVPANIQALQSGQTYKIGVYGGSYFTELYLAELIVYSNKLTDAQIIQVESYLNSKYQIY